MEQEIKRIIEEHLPTQTAGVMKKYLAQAEATADELDSATNVITSLEKTVAEYKKKDSLYNEMKAMHMDLDLRVEALNKREAIITQRENNATVIESNIKMTMMLANMDNMLKLVDKVFGHPATSIQRSVPVVEPAGMADQYGNVQYPSVTQRPETTTETEGKS